MAVGIKGSEIELDEAEADRAARIANVSDIVMSASFNEAALPLGFETLNQRKLMGADRYGDFSFTTGGGRITEINGNRFDASGRKLDDEGDDEELADTADNIDRQFKREREREEWSQSNHTYFGATMTGKQWGDLADELKSGGALHKALVDRMVKDGKTKEEAEKKAAEMTKVYDILRRPPSQWKSEERQRVEASKADPDFQKYTNALSDSANLTVHRELEKTASGTTTQESVRARSDILNADFPTAPRATEHHRQAVAATEPLDVPKPSVKIAAAITNAPAPAAAAGFDI